MVVRAGVWHSHAGMRVNARMVRRACERTHASPSVHQDHHSLPLFVLPFWLRWTQAASLFVERRQTQSEASGGQPPGERGEEHQAQEQKRSTAAAVIPGHCRARVTLFFVCIRLVIVPAIGTGICIYLCTQRVSGAGAQASGM